MRLHEEKTRKGLDVHNIRVNDFGLFVDREGGIQLRNEAILDFPSSRLCCMFPFVCLCVYLFLLIFIFYLITNQIYTRKEKRCYLIPFLSISKSNLL